MSMGNKMPPGMFNNQGFTGGYTPPYGSGSAANMYGGGYGGGTYDPMLGFGQSSGMGTTYDYPTRYSADYTRYAQSGQPFNQPVMGYNTYGQIFSQPQRPPPPIMGGGKGGMGGGFGGFRPQPPSFGGKGGGGFGGGMGGGFGNQFGGGFGNQFGGFGNQQRRFRQPERRTNQLGLNQPPRNTNVSVGTIPNQNPPGNIFTGGFGNNEPSRVFPGDFSNNVPEPMFDMNQEFISYPGGSTPTGRVGQSLPPDITGSPFGPLIGQPAQQASGSVEQNMNNPAYQQQMAFQQGNSEEAIRNRIQRELNEQFTRDQNLGMTGSALYKAQDELQNKLYSQYGLEPYQMGPQSGGGFGLINPGFGAMQFQEGGQVPPDANMEMMLSEAGPANPQSEMAGEYDRLIQMTMQAILGQVENPDEVIQMFIDEFGVDSFRQLRDAVLKQQVPNAQTEGMVDGNGGGMDDQVMGMIGNQRPVAVSPGEYIVPADVVSGLGDGSSKSGADILDELNQAVRMARTGTTEQPRPLMETLQ